jgi:hypothetical protein
LEICVWFEGCHVGGLLKLWRVASTFRKWGFRETR